jgi:hypothetical protein
MSKDRGPRSVGGMLRLSKNRGVWEMSFGKWHIKDEANTVVLKPNTEEDPITGMTKEEIAETCNMLAFEAIKDGWQVYILTENEQLVDMNNLFSG